MTPRAGGFGADPVIDHVNVDYQCGSDGNLVDDPVESISAEDRVV